MMLSESARASWTSLPAHASNHNEIPALTTCGEYTVYPMQYCTEDQVAKLFSKICQRGNPVLQGRPAADLILLGRAMYRKANLMKTGQVAVHNGEPVAVGFGWDVAEGGVWKGSGLEMPASLAAHAACGKAAFESLTARGKTFFGGFYGVLPPHDGVFFGYLAVSGFMMAHQMGFEDGFQYTLLPTLNKRGGVFGKFGKDGDNVNWHLPFSDIAAADHIDKAISDELCDLGGTVNVSLTNLDYAINGEEWMARCAATVRLPSSEEMRQPSQLMAANQVQWMRQTQSTNMIISRL
jgi:hypothetical protein